MDKEKIITVLVTGHGFSAGEAEKMYENASIVITGAVNLINDTVEKLKSIFEDLVEYFTKHEYFEPLHKWSPVLDTRRASQVTLNKPRFMVRKII